MLKQISRPFTQHQSPTQKWLEFILVETPEEARSNKPPEQTNLVSDKNAAASDLYQKKDKPIGDPYSKGDLNIKGLTSEKDYPSPPAPPVTASREGQETAAKKNNNSDEFLASSYVFQKFSRQQLLRNSPSNVTSQFRPGANVPGYDNRETNAESYGGLSFNTYAWDFAPYMLEMKRKVERNVYPPPAFSYMGLISGETILRFKVIPNGEVKDLVVLKYTGHESLKETSVKAILNSSRFRELPADFPEDFLEVTAKFTYYITRR
jgi:outer membrane biosynthesis protein TonB